MAGSELGKDRSLRRSTVCSIHSRSLEDMPSYSVFMFSISTMRPIIWGEGGRERGRERGREGRRREGRKERENEGGKEGGKKGGREGKRERE